MKLNLMKTSTKLNKANPLYRKILIYICEGFSTFSVQKNHMINFFHKKLFLLKSLFNQTFFHSIILLMESQKNVKQSYARGKFITFILFYFIFYFVLLLKCWNNIHVLENKKRVF
jgi:hypothetical protein